MGPVAGYTPSSRLPPPRSATVAPPLTRRWFCSRPGRKGTASVEQNRSLQVTPVRPRSPPRCTPTPLPIVQQSTLTPRAGRRIEEPECCKVPSTDLKAEDIREGQETEHRMASAFRMSGAAPRSAGDAPWSCATGPPSDLSVLGMDIFQVADGLITGVWAVADLLGPLAAASAVSARPRQPDGTVATRDSPLSVR